MTPEAQNRRLLLAAALLLGVVALWWFGRAHGPARGPETAPDSRPKKAPEASAPAGPAAPGAGEKGAANPGEAAVDWREPERRSGVDASNIYKDAFVLFNALTEEEKRMLKNPKDEVDADAAAALFQKIQPILAKLREAMRADYCEWGLAPYSFETRLTHITPAQGLGQLALWSAAYRMNDEPAEAMIDLQTRARLGHHLSSDTLIGGLVAASFEGGAIELLRGRVGTLPPTERAKAVALFAESTVEAGLQSAFATEADMAQRMVKQIGAMSPEERRKLVGSFNPAIGDDPAQAPHARIARLFADPARVQAEATFIRQVEEQMGASLALPEAEFQAWWTKVEADMRANHPLAEMMIPSLHSVRASMLRRRVERTVFLAGIDVLENGPAHVAKYRDPVTDAPLQYVSTPGGFELRASYRVKDKPVTLTFAAPGKGG